MAGSSLTTFYHLCRAVLVKTGLTTTASIWLLPSISTEWNPGPAETIWEWLDKTSLRWNH